MIGTIGIVTLRVEQWQAMVEFYRDRLGLRPAMVDEAHQYAMFDTGAVRLALEGPAHPAFARGPGRPAMMLNFQTDNGQRGRIHQMGRLGSLTRHYGTTSQGRHSAGRD